MALEQPMPTSRIVLCTAVALGSAVGALSRFGSASIIADLWGAGDLVATAFVNIVGSFVIALYATLTATRGAFPMSESSRQFVMAGFCGGYTTRSLMGLDTFMIILDHHAFYGVAYVTGVVAMSLLAAASGYGLGRMFDPRSDSRTMEECRALS
ncbi:Camphor resistance CrcB protein [Rhodopseudomonas palustris HaA2]|uniref:Fluoride-specific ion channel FluC n=2 Tax=Rhodopseudomonas palustris TaxID=1076 RepID=Q2J3P8_RHOP2|nr:Camphor resistance CrcB protein [Rhodopseudomonas palustris HaA2]